MLIGSVNDLDFVLLLPGKKPVAGRIKLKQALLNCHL